MRRPKDINKEIWKQWHENYTDADNCDGHNDCLKCRMYEIINEFECGDTLDEYLRFMIRKQRKANQ